MENLQYLKLISPIPCGIITKDDYLKFGEMNMGKLEKSLNDTVEEILGISPKMTVAKIAKLIEVNPRSIYRTKAWKGRKKGVMSV